MGHSLQSSSHGAFGARHIIPPTDDEELAAYNDAKVVDLPLWKRLDAVVRQWIYVTLSPDILTAILVLGDVAKQAWKRVAQIFQDNQNSRPAFLETEFTTTKMVDFPNVIAYYNRLKSLAGQLANVGSPVSDTRLVLPLLADLSISYKNFVTNIQQRDVLPTFSQLCSRLKLEDTTTKEWERESRGSSALIVGDDTPPQPPQHHNGGNQNNNNNHNYNNRDNRNRRNNNNNRGRCNNNSNRGGKSGRGGGQTSSHQYTVAQPPASQWPYLGVCTVRSEPKIGPEPD
ncbi:uncharacterized protein [Spinacia oleracea]|uniref:Retrotransposon gag domain-containing protein n=1 Tax=Spinacia oleracea TaxID=3562 RepID=A0A9R0JUU6_SPIOL|nr:uncharacterized protein LOC110787544 [Spinacia oleracea]